MTTKLLQHVESKSNQDAAEPAQEPRPRLMVLSRAAPYIGVSRSVLYELLKVGAPYHTVIATKMVDPDDVVLSLRRRPEASESTSKAIPGLTILS